MATALTIIPRLHVQFNDADLLNRLQQLGKRQIVPVSRAAMIRAIMQEAMGTDDCDQILDRLDAMAQDLPVASTRTQLVLAILRAAVSDQRGAPIEKWRENITSFIDRIQHQILPSAPDTVSGAEATDGPSPTSPHCEAAGQETPALPRKQKRRAG